MRERVKKPEIKEKSEERKKEEVRRERLNKPMEHLHFQEAGLVSKFTLETEKSLQDRMFGKRVLRYSIGTYTHT